MTPITPPNWDHSEENSKWLVHFNCPGTCSQRWKISDRKVNNTGELLDNDGGRYECSVCGFNDEIRFAGFARQGPPR